MSPSPCILLTRESQDNAALAKALRDGGVPVREIPCVETHFVIPKMPPPVADAIAFASRRSVHGYIAAQYPFPSVVAAVGEVTADALRQAGHPPSIIAKPATAEALAVALARGLSASSRVLVPHGNQRGSLSDSLVRVGLNPTGLVVYENREPAMPALDPCAVAAVFVAAPSAVERILRHYPWLRNRPFLAIGPTTQRALQSVKIPRQLGMAATIDEQINQLTAAWRSEYQP